MKAVRPGLCMPALQTIASTRAGDGGRERAHRPERPEVELVAPGRHDVPARGAHRGGRLAPEAARGAGDEHAHRKPSTTLNGV